MINTDMYKDYSDCYTPYDYPISFENNCMEYMQDKNIPTYTMDYEDTTSIPFRISDKYSLFEIQISVYNFRHECIYYTDQYVDENNIVRLNIDYETSSTIFKPGMYYVKLQAVGYSNDETDNIQVSTILPLDACSIYVR